MDPQEERITVLTLVDDTYTVHDEFERGTEATSLLLKGFATAVAEVLGAAENS